MATPFVPRSSSSASSRDLFGVLSVFRHRIFFLLWTGAFVSNIGNWMENVGQGWAVVRGAAPGQNASFLVEVLSFADFAPVLFLALLAGVLADRVNRKVWLIFLQSFACLLGAGLAVVGFLGHATPWIVIGFTFAEGIIWALNGPAWLTIVPMLVPRDELPKAIALNSVQFNLARLVGPVIAGFIISISSINVAFAINAATFFLVIFALFFLPKQPRPARPADTHISADLFAGIHYVWTHRGIRRLILMAAVFMFLAAPVQGLLAVFAQQILGGRSSLYGLMLGAIGLGSVSGAIILGYLPRYYPRHHLIPLSMCLFCAAALAYSFSVVPALSLALLACCGVFWLMSLNPANTANQLLATDENRGRVMSIMLLANQGSMPLGHLFAGVLTHYFSPQWVVRLMVGTLFCVMLFFLFIREPAIDNMERRRVPRRSLLWHLWEAITAHSHRPEYPAEVPVDPAGAAAKNASQPLRTSSTD